MNTLRLARFIERSEANGPGVRSVFWFQGCTLGCAGCINAWSHPADGEARDVTPSELLAMVPPDVEGITLSGGEPFQQNHEALYSFLLMARRRNLSVLVFTGYDLAELYATGSFGVHAMLGCCIDILVAGRFDIRRRVKNLPLVSSDNQKLHLLTGRYTEFDLWEVPTSEVVFDLDAGAKVRTGFL